jgi:hypothetical protein
MNPSGEEFIITDPMFGGEPPGALARQERGERYARERFGNRSVSGIPLLAGNSAVDHQPP